MEGRRNRTKNIAELSNIPVAGNLEQCSNLLFSYENRARRKMASISQSTGIAFICIGDDFLIVKTFSLRSLNAAYAFASAKSGDILNLAAEPHSLVGRMFEVELVPLTSC